MNFYFTIKSRQFKCKLTIPKFDNNGRIDKNIKLFQATIQKNHWLIKNVTKYEKGNFFILNNEDIDNEKVFFLAKENQVFGNDLTKSSVETKELFNFSNYTDTYPDYRSNLKIYNDLASSSYQSEYPFKMLSSRGGILSPIFPLTNTEADLNKIFFRNIFYLPLKEEFFAYIIDIKEKTIVKKILLRSNSTNEIELKTGEITKNSYFFTKSFVGIPIFVSQKDDSVSMEHTHPPHHYLYDKNKFQIIKNLKKSLNEILD